MIKNLEEKKMMLHCFTVGLKELGFGEETTQHIIEDHFLPLTTFKNEYEEVLLEAFKDVIEQLSKECSGNEYN